MSLDFTYPVAVVILGIISATIVFVVLSRISNKTTTFFQLYPETKWILPISLKLVTWCISGVVFLLFLQYALYIGELSFTANIVAELIFQAPKYVLAIMLVLAGFYVSRMVKEKSATHSFEQKNRVLLVVDFIIHMTFFFTALAVIGVDTQFFALFYMVALGVIGFIVAITIGLSIGIPFGVTMYNKLNKNRKK